MIKAQDALYANEAFIPKEFCDSYRELLALSIRQTYAYTRRFGVHCPPEEKDTFRIEDFERTIEIQKKWNELTDQIRKHLSSLEVVSQI